MLNKKKRYRVSIIEEGITEGTLVLTEKEAKFLAYATNPENWDDSKIETCSGHFYIDLKHPMKIDEHPMEEVGY